MSVLFENKCSVTNTLIIIIIIIAIIMIIIITNNNNYENNKLTSTVSKLAEIKFRGVSYQNC